MNHSKSVIATIFCPVFFALLLGLTQMQLTAGDDGHVIRLPEVVATDSTTVTLENESPAVEPPAMEGPELNLNEAEGSAGAKPAGAPHEGEMPQETPRMETPSQPGGEGPGKPETPAESPASPPQPEQKPEAARPAPQTEKPRSTVDVTAVGRPLAPGIAKLVAPEIASQFRSAGIDSRFQQFRNYAASRLAATRGDYTASEINGLGRLSWFDHLLRNPLNVPEESEQFTRYLHAGAISERAEGLRFLLQTGRARMDVPASSVTTTVTADQSDPLDFLAKVIVAARRHYDQSIKPLSSAELSELARRLNPVLTTNTFVGHTVNDRGGARRLVQILNKMDRAAQWDMADTLAQLVDRPYLESLRESLKSQRAGGSPAIAGVTGQVLKVVETPAGYILVGGPGANEYRLEELKSVAAVVDLGGDDLYWEGTCTVERPILVIIDLAGNDKYQGKLPGIQAASILGGSLLIDFEGDDLYWGQDLAQGSTLGGVGILVDWSGNDRYQGLRRAQGQAIGGVGLLIDRDGQDDYRAAMWAQGFGGPLGFGLIDDLAGDDRYYVGGRWYDSYPETPGYDGWGQGVGSGIRGATNGGIGVLLEGSGDDVYEFDYFGQGGGYWLGMGFARDFAGNDQRLGATLKAFDGSARTQQRFQRFGNGWGCHMAVGALIDDDGNDEYHGSIMGTGFAWDLSVGYLMDFGGDDRYLARVGGVQGQGAQAGLGVLFDFEGADEYAGTSQGYASSSITYHPYPTCGGNFSFVIDYGGLDKYGSGVRNNAISRRGSGGFVVDRPKLEELEAAEASPDAPVTRASLRDQ